MRLIQNADLTLADIPVPDADIDEIGWFALTFDGYEHWGSFEECADVANSGRQNTLTPRSRGTGTWRRFFAMTTGQERHECLFWDKKISYRAAQTPCGSFVRTSTMGSTSNHGPIYH